MHSKQIVGVDCRPNLSQVILHAPVEPALAKVSTKVRMSAGKQCVQKPEVADSSRKINGHPRNLPRPRRNVIMTWLACTSRGLRGKREKPSKTADEDRDWRGGKADDSQRLASSRCSPHEVGLND
jgi:hypothetical protein